MRIGRYTCEAMLISPVVRQKMDAVRVDDPVLKAAGDIHLCARGERSEIESGRRRNGPRSFIGIAVGIVMRNGEIGRGDGDNIAAIHAALEVRIVDLGVEGAQDR